MAAVLDIPSARKASKRREVRVLHVIENLQDHAIDAWLLRTFERAVIDYPHIKWTFFCVLPEPGEFDERVTIAGGQVIHSRHRMHERVLFVKGLRDVIRKGNYDVLHCHHDITSGVYLLASLGLPLRKRIVHLHNTELGLPTPSKFKQRLLKSPLRQLCLRADHIVGSSNDALRSILGNSPRRNGRDLVVHYGLDTARFRVPLEDRAEWRRKFGINPNAKVMLFVGRLVEYKNPLFVIEVLQQMRKSGQSVELLVAGIGPLSDSIKVLAKEKRIESYVHLAGFRKDVPTLMLQSDMLIWPSQEHPKEGLGLGIVEAQTAGLPILMSQSVPEEAIVIPELIRVLPMSDGVENWSLEALDILSVSPPAKIECFRRVTESSFSLEQGINNLMKLYDGFN